MLLVLLPSRSGAHTQVPGVFATRATLFHAGEARVPSSRYHMLKRSLLPRSSPVPAASASAHTLCKAEIEFLNLNWRQICKGLAVLHAGCPSAPTQKSLRPLPVNCPPPTLCHSRSGTSNTRCSSVCKCAHTPTHILLNLK